MTRRSPHRRGLPGVAVAAVVALLLGPLGSTSAQAANATIEGSVTEADAPVARVTVSAYRWDDERGSWDFEQESETAPDGTWALDFLPDGAYTLQFDTSVSTARFALGESLGRNATYADDEPTFEIADGTTRAAPFAEHELERWGGEVTLSVTDGGETLIDLDDAVAQLRGIDMNGDASESQREYADESGVVTISRVPAGGYVPWVAARGEAAAPAPTDALVLPGAAVDLGAAALGPAPEGTLVGGEPALTGESRAGETLTIVDPEFDPDPERVSHRWSAAGSALSETSASLELTEPLIGESVTAWVFAHRAGAAPFIGLVASDPVAPAAAGAGADAAASGTGAAADASGSSTAGGAAAGDSDSAGADASAAAGGGSDAGSDGAGAGAGGSGGGDGSEDGPLPVTGAELTGIVALALALLAGGAILVLRRRNRLDPAAPGSE
ncbi:carboxypeptidase-like regulatory domain-containing protein [Leucobacter chromiiresistens]|uniref:carboxypeptidase-like regulatory domain-containing protein n=1 Tax=Leucobacter chromiiresistens TaxID=1079994 RepID=UPI00187C251E|nr:carboxypeptidase-like regulatory domain-containing protein [Leucobacter chromiiresistens]